MPMDPFTTLDMPQLIKKIQDVTASGKAFPLRVMGLLLLLGVVLLAATWLVWRFVTPEQCLPTPENIQRAMNDIAASPYSKQLP